MGAHNGISLGTNAGAAPVFVRDGSGNGQLQQALAPSEGAGGNAFGWDVAVSGDHAADSSGQGAGVPDSGLVFVFTRTGTTWTAEARLQAPAPEAGDLFGSVLALSGDTLVVGRPFASRGLETQVGAVHAYVREAPGSWRHDVEMWSGQPDEQGHALGDGRDRSVDASRPAAGAAGWYYLVGAASACGASAVGQDSRGTAIAAAAPCLPTRCP